MPASKQPTYRIEVDPDLYAELSYMAIKQHLRPKSLVEKWIREHMENHPNIQSAKNVESPAIDAPAREDRELPDPGTSIQPKATASKHPKSRPSREHKSTSAEDTKLLSSALHYLRPALAQDQHPTPGQIAQAVGTSPEKIGLLLKRVGLTTIGSKPRHYSKELLPQVEALLQKI